MWLKQPFFIYVESNVLKYDLWIQILVFFFKTIQFNADIASRDCKFRILNQISFYFCLDPEFFGIAVLLSVMIVCFVF